MINPRQLRDLVVRPTLAYLGLPGGEVAERLVMGTAAQESKLRHIHQLGRGPARGLWQMEPATFADLWERTDERVAEGARYWLGKSLRQLVAKHPEPVDQLIGNLYLGCAMCRVHYYMRPFNMPTVATVRDLGAIWKQHYNTVKGKGTVEEFVGNYRALLAGLYDADKMVEKA
jgi:hypothetical protein